MIEREITPYLVKLFEQYPFVTVTGPRQSGKTTLCRATSISAPLICQSGVAGLVREGRIVEIGRELSQGTHGSEGVIDGAGRFRTLGLKDAHTHLSEVPGMIFKHESAYPNIARDARRQIPRSCLYYCFTTVIDLIARSDVIAKWNEIGRPPSRVFLWSGAHIRWLSNEFHSEALSDIG